MFIGERIAYYVQINLIQRFYVFEEEVIDAINFFRNTFFILFKSGNIRSFFFDYDESVEKDLIIPEMSSKIIKILAASVHNQDKTAFKFLFQLEDNSLVFVDTFSKSWKI